MQHLVPRVLCSTLLLLAVVPFVYSQSGSILCYLIFIVILSDLLSGFGFVSFFHHPSLIISMAVRSDLLLLSFLTHIPLLSYSEGGSSSIVSNELTKVKEE